MFPKKVVAHKLINAMIIIKQLPSLIRNNQFAPTTLKIKIW